MEKQEAAVGGADNTALLKPPPESLGAGAGGAGARGCRHGAGARGLRGGPCQHPASSQPSPSPSAEGRGLLSASQLPAGILGCNELLRSQASTWQRWVVFALEQRTPKEEEGGGGSWGTPPPSRDRSGTAAQPCHELAGSQRRSHAGISLAPRLGCSSRLFSPE